MSSGGKGIIDMEEHTESGAQVFLGVSAIKNRAGKMKAKKWRAARGERKSCSKGREKESVVRSR